MKRSPLLFFQSVTLLACAKPAATPAKSPAPSASLAAPAPAPAPAPLSPPEADTLSFDDLAKEAPPRMRELARSDALLNGIALTLDKDACLRAAVTASKPVRAWFEDGTHALRGAQADGANLVPPRGPTCAKKGETLRFVVIGADAAATFPRAARAIVWQSP